MLSQPAMSAWSPGNAVRWRFLLLALCLCWLTGTAAGLALPPLPGQQAGGLKEFAFAQPFFEAIGEGDMIPEGIVTALVQDSKGMLWIGTQIGLLRFDGYRFRKFLANPDEPNSLVDNHINRLWLAPDGRLWIGSATNGLSVYDPHLDRFTNFHPDHSRPDALSGQEISALTGDADGGIWVGTREDGLNYLAPGASGFRHFRHVAGDPASLLDDRVRSLLVDSKGQLWVGGVNGLQRLLRSKAAFEQIASDPLDPASLAGQTVRTLFEAHDGKLWLGTNANGVAWLDMKQEVQNQQRNQQANQPQSQQPETVPGKLLLHRPPRQDPLSERLAHSIITTIAQPEPDQIWLGQRNGGIVILHAGDGRVLQHFAHDSSVASSLALDTVTSLLHDKSGLLWIGTLGGGLQRLNLRNHAFRMLRYSPTRHDSLSHANILSVLELDNGQLLVGTDGNGIDILDRKQGLIGGYRVQPGKPGSLADASIFSMVQTTDGTIWAGSQRNGLQRLASGSKIWQTFGLAQGLPDNRISRLLAGRDGELWVGTDRGLARWQAGRARFETFVGKDGSSMHSPVHALAEDRAGRLWIGTSEGLWLREPGNPALQSIVHERSRPASLAANSVSGLLFDSRGQLWVDTAQGLDRLQQWDGKQAEFEHISAKSGVPGLIFDGNMLEDKRGRIWSHRMLFDPKLRRFYPVTKADGFFIGTSWTGSYGTTRDGLLLFGGTQGLGIVAPELFEPWDYQPPVVASELKIDGVGQPLGRLLPELRLQPGQRNFVVEFAALDYSAPQKSRYAYRLQGYDRDWIQSDAEHRNAGYGNLWPGNYVLQVRGTNRNGEWSLQQLEIPIRVLPLLWQTNWFMALLLVLLCSLIALAWRWRISRMRQRARATQSRLRAEALSLQQMVQSRTADILKLGTIGQELTATLDTEQAFERVYRQISARLDAWVFSIGIYDEAASLIRIQYLIEGGQRLTPLQYAMSETDRPAVWCVRERRELVAGTPDELLQYVASILPAKSGRLMASIVYLPLIAEQRVIGCLSVQSPQTRAYNEDQIKFLHVLASYTAIAVANSQAHQALANAHQRLQATQQQLVLQEKMAGLGTLTAGVAHEINNPTNFVHVAAQNLRVDLNEFRQFTTDLINAEDAPEVLQAFTERFETLAGHVSVMLQGTERIKGIVRDLRAFTRLEQAEKKVMRLSECLLSTLNLVRTSWQDQVEFVTEFDDDPAMECWPALLNQVFMNLLINACQAIAARAAQQLQDGAVASPGKVIIRMQLQAAQIQDALLQISFIDNGTGMRPELQARILEPFFTTKPVGEGTGLGLSIAYGIILQHGGNLLIRSTPGEGSCFTLCLPVATNERQADGILCTQ